MALDLNQLRDALSDMGYSVKFGSDTPGIRNKDGTFTDINDIPVLFDRFKPIDELNTDSINGGKIEYTNFSNVTITEKECLEKKELDVRCFHITHLSENSSYNINFFPEESFFNIPFYSSRESRKTNDVYTSKEIQCQT